MRVVNIYIRSEGCEDPGIAQPCGLAYIKVDGTDRSLHNRGYNVVVVDGATGKGDSLPSVAGDFVGAR